MRTSFFSAAVSAVTIFHELGASSAANCVVGSVYTYPVATIPDGFLECDGSQYKISEYSELFDVIGGSYGYFIDSDSEIYFNVPDYRGYFLRGWDNNAGIDQDSSSRSDRGDGTKGDNVGTIQSDEFESHTHEAYVSNAKYSGGGADKPVADPSTGDTGNYLTSDPIVSTGGSETRPKNIYVSYIICAYNIVTGIPTSIPTSVPTSVPTVGPTIDPSVAPTTYPTIVTAQPSTNPTHTTLDPTMNPIAAPSYAPHSPIYDAISTTSINVAEIMATEQLAENEYTMTNASEIIADALLTHTSETIEKSTVVMMAIIFAAILLLLIISMIIMCIYFEKQMNKQSEKLMHVAESVASAGLPNALVNENDKSEAIANFILMNQLSAMETNVNKNKGANEIQLQVESSKQKRNEKIKNNTINIIGTENNDTKMGLEGNGLNGLGDIDDSDDSLTLSIGKFDKEGDNIANHTSTIDNAILYNNYQEWTQEQVSRWIKLILLNNDTPNQVVTAFIREFNTKTVDGKQLAIFAQNEASINKFVAQFSQQNQSYLIWMTIKSEIQSLLQTQLVGS